MAATGNFTEVTVQVNKTDRGLGMKISGGSDAASKVFSVTEVSEGGAAEAAGVLVNDVILSVDGKDLTDVKHADGIEAFKQTKDTFEMVLRRVKQNKWQATTEKVLVGMMMNLDEQAKEASARAASRASSGAAADGVEGAVKEKKKRRSSDLEKAKPKASNKEEKALELDPAKRYAESTMEPITKGVGNFGCRLTNLVELISERGDHGLERLHVKFGGIEGLAAKVRTDLHNGVPGDQTDLEERHRVFGKNRVPPPRSKGLLELMWEALHDQTLIILLCAGAISLILELTIGEDKTIGWIEGFAIMVSVFIVTFVTAVNDIQKEKQFKQLQAKQNAEKITDVIRGGKQIPISEFDLVVGDLWVVTIGAIIPADGVLIRASDITCDESALTGESKDIEKKVDKDPWLVSGASIKSGSGVMLVTSVGLFSEEGIIKKLITGVGQEESDRLLELDAAAGGKVDVSAKNEEIENNKKKEEKGQRKKESVLQVKLTKLAISIGKAGTFVAAGVILVLFVRYFIERFGIDSDHPSASQTITDLIGFFIVGVTVLVVAVPEGLPLAVTIALAFSVKKMMKDNNLVRVLAACETMGNATTICSDKTGTLTKNRMTVIKCWIAGKIYDNVLEAREQVLEIRENIALHGACNSSPGATYVFKEGESLPTQDGNKTECAILHFADQIYDKTFKQVRQEFPDREFVKVFPFDSARKRMTTVIRLKDGRFRVFVKGASEIILTLCTHRQNMEGKPVPLTEQDHASFKQDIIIRFAEQALRVICMAYRDFDTERSWEDEAELAQNLTISCFVGIMDPLRDEVADAVKTCQEAGVIVRMVTGDNMITARAIALNAGIISPNDDFIVMEGPDFRKKILNTDGSINHEELGKIWPKLRVIGRCSPTDKYNLVKGLIHAGQVVAVTGDGTNDGPALSEADVGFAMGIAGTGVAKEASDIIITDDNFSSIVKAISWGRNVYDSIAKFLQFQLTVNLVAITIAFIGACALNESPLRAVQLLWVNLIMDSFASLALATEPPTPELLKRAPYGRNAPLISPLMARSILGHGAYQLAILLMLVFVGDKIFDIESGRERDHNADPTQHYSIVFNTFVMMQLFNEINAKKIHGEWNPFKGFFNNPIYVAILIGTFGVQVLIIEFGSRAFKVTGLTGIQWLACILFGFGELLWNLVLIVIFPPSVFPKKWFEPRKKKNKKNKNKGSSATVEDGMELKPLEDIKGPEVQPGELVDDEEEDDDSSDDEEIPTRPEDAHRLRIFTPGTLLWSRGVNRLRTHLRIVSAFRTAGHRTRLRRRTSMLGQLALGGPEARAAVAPHPAEGVARAVPTPATAMWRTAAARIRFQLRVVKMFKAGLRRQSTNRDPRSTANLLPPPDSSFLLAPEASPIPPPSPKASRSATDPDAAESVV